MRVLSRLFRRLFLTYLQEAFDAHRLHVAGSLTALTDARAFAGHLAPARQTEWVVYATRPFAGPQQVLDYVGRYTHRIAISNERLLDLDDGRVTFRYKDYRAAGPEAHKTMTLEAAEFIRRFLLHVLPSRFHRIRYYGLFGNWHRTGKLAQCRHVLGMASQPLGGADPMPLADRSLAPHVPDLSDRAHDADRTPPPRRSGCRRPRQLVRSHRLPRPHVDTDVPRHHGSRVASLPARLRRAAHTSGERQGARGITSPIAHTVRLVTPPPPGIRRLR